MPKKDSEETKHKFSSRNDNPVAESPERPTFSTNIFDEREEHELEPKRQEQEPFDAHHWFWLSIVMAIFLIGVASSYYMIHYF